MDIKIASPASRLIRELAEGASNGSMVASVSKPVGSGITRLSPELRAILATLKPEDMEGLFPLPTVPFRHGKPTYYPSRRGYWRLPENF